MSFRTRLSAWSVTPSGALQTIKRGYTTKPLFDKILIANRGEIACRVMKTCKKMGIKTVAIHSDVDANCLHVRMADEAYCVGPAPSNKSYLVIDNILKAIKDTGANAVHPGYGFLSENSHFAAALKERGVAFIAPNVGAIEAMGDKIQSKILAKKAGVSCIPGFDGEIPTPDDAVKHANMIGYPVMIKASAGGGGKGMRIAWNDNECREAFRLSKQEAASSFGDDRMLVEKYIDNPRHVEIQVIGDKHGNVVYVNERECSIQRRNQKVIEEAPSSFVDEALRKKMGAEAIMLAKAVNYDSAGTVELLMDSQHNFYFLEMNTRLQVEHAISESISGVDLVEQMIRSAAGLPLNITQNDIHVNGWSFEARVYAEDSTKLLPSVGKLKTYVEPQGEGIRIDSGIIEGSEISMYYDPMISKLITHGETRQEALDLMCKALDKYVICGVVHNIPLLRDILSNERFKKGDISTKFIAETYPEGFRGRKWSEVESQNFFITAAFLGHLKKRREFSISTDGKVVDNGKQDASTFAVTIGDSINAVRVYKDTKVLANGGIRYAVSLAALENHSELSLPESQKVSHHFIESNYDENTVLIEATIDGNREVVMQNLAPIREGLKMSYQGTQVDVFIRSIIGQDYFKYMIPPPAVDFDKILVAPMHGRVVSVAVEVGDKVVPGQEVAVVEAMKMQNSLRAAAAGKVKALYVKENQNVSIDEVLVEFE